MPLQSPCKGGFLEHLVLILATQRVGSTYFERGLQHMGGLGRPFEVFSRVRKDLAAMRDPDAMRALFEERLSMGRTEADGTVGMTMMASYFGLVARAYLGRTGPKHRNDLADWLEFWTAFHPRFDRVIAFRLTRDPLDQAISQLFSEETRVNHMVDGAPVRLHPQTSRGSLHSLQRIEAPPRMTHVAAVPALSPRRILKRIEKLSRQNAELDAFEAVAGLQVLRIDYAEATAAPEETARRIANHAGGLAATMNFAPDTTKVVPQDAAALVKDNLAQYLGLGAADRSTPGSLSAAAVAAASDKTSVSWRVRRALQDAARWLATPR